MSKAETSLFIFGIYSLVNGLGLLLIPNDFLSIFTLPETNEVWVRIAGWLICILGFYYVSGARLHVEKFVRITIPGRIAVFGLVGEI